MFITKQHTSELTNFIKNKSRYSMELTFATLGEVHEVVKWCQENFQGDGAGKTMSSQSRQNNAITIRWYMVNKLDFVAFKLRWG